MDGVLQDGQHEPLLALKPGAPREATEELRRQNRVRCEQFGQLLVGPIALIRQRVHLHRYTS